MSTVRAARRRDAMRPGVRLGLLGLAVAIGWLLLALFTGGSSAAADTGDDQDGLLGSVLGGVTQTTATVTQTTTEVVQTTSATVQQAVQTVQPVVASVTQVAPSAPAAPVVSAVVEVTTQVAATVPVAAKTVVETASDLAGSVQLGSVTAPVSAVVDVVVDAAGDSLPVVGAVVEELLGTTTPGAVIDSVVGDVDDAVDGLIRDTAPAVIASPEVPDTVSDLGPALIGTLLPDAVAAAEEISGPAGLMLASAAGASAPGGGLGAPSAPAPGGSDAPAAPAPAPTGSGLGGAANGGASAGASSISDAVSAAFGHGAMASLVLGAVRDELPSSPVFETDSTPD